MVERRWPLDDERPTNADLAAATKLLANYYSRNMATSWATWLGDEWAMFDKRCRQGRGDELG